MEEKPDLLAVLDRAGVRLPDQHDRPFFVHCPFHNDQTHPNLRVDPQRGLFHCFACGVGGDAYSFVGLQLFGPSFNNRSPDQFRAVCAVLARDAVPTVRLPPLPRTKALNQEIVQALTLAARFYHLALMGPAGKHARSLLESRGIDLPAQRRFRLGFAPPGALAGILATYPPSLRRSAEEAGLFVTGRNGQPRELLANRILFPDLARNGSVIHILGRSVDPAAAATVKYLALGGLPRTIWGLASCRRSKPVILTESTVDALNMKQMGLQGAAAGGTGLAAHLLPDLKRHLVVILPQQDAAGQEAVSRWKAQLPGSRILDAYVFEAGEKDLNDRVCRAGLKAAETALRQALSAAGVAA